MKPSTDTAAICGLFCGTCPSYPNECGGCLSSHVAAECAVCHNGFRTCAKAHGATRCSDCADFPCERLHEFSKKHIVNGICHHKHVIQNLESIRQSGAEEFVQRQTQENTCKSCGRLIEWYNRECRRCNK